MHVSILTFTVIAWRPVHLLKRECTTIFISLNHARELVFHVIINFTHLYSMCVLFYFVTLKNLYVNENLHILEHYCDVTWTIVVFPYICAQKLFVFSYS